jgi:chromosome transmission fidelity protein 1
LYIFFESKQAIDRSANGIFSQYCSHIDLGLGAILLAVVGGKLSEGINFSDDYGRAVVMVGLPYTAPSAEIELKKSFYSKHGFSSQEFLDSVAMKAVNQSIGTDGYI